MINEPLKDLINEKVREYYYCYYFLQLGLPDYEERIKSRQSEDDNYIYTINRVKDQIPFFYLPKEGKKVLIQGAGTGQEFVAFSKMGYEVYGIEPYQKAVDILKLKCEFYNYDFNRIKQCSAEQLSFEDNCFDLVWSWTVLEHVQDVEKSIKEIVRVLKPGGWAFFGMPDYNHLYEPHYKMYLPMFLPKFILKLILICFKRPPGFLDYGINYITTKRVRKILQTLSVDSYLKVHSWPKEWSKQRSWKMELIYRLYHHFGVPKDQWWILQNRK